MRIIGNFFSIVRGKHKISTTHRFFIIDLLRVFAALSVFFTHFSAFLNSGISKGIVQVFYKDSIQFLAWANGGMHFGVVIFIVISGFIIHYPSLHAQTDYSRQHWNLFLKKRLLRIGPIYIISVLLGILVYFCMKSGYYSAANLISNNILVLGCPFFNFNSSDFPLNNTILHTVVVEFYLYIILYPFLVLLNKKRGLYGSFLFLILIIVTDAMLYFNVSDTVWLGGSFYVFAIYWAIGFIAAEVTYGIQRGTQSLKVSKSQVFLLGVAYCLSRIVNFHGAHFFKSILLSIIIALLVIVFHKKKSRNGWLNRISDVSYSMYAVHWPLLLITAYLLNINRVTGMLHDALLLGAVSLGISITYKLVEKPSHQWSRRLFKIERQN